MSIFHKLINKLKNIKKTAEPVEQPIVAELEAEPVEQPIVEPAVAELEAEPVEQPIVEPAVAELEAEPVEQPIVEPAVAELEDEPVEQPIVEPAVAELEDEPAVAELEAEPVEQPIVAELEDEPVEQPIVEPAVAELEDEPVEQPAVAELEDEPVEQLAFEAVPNVSLVADEEYHADKLSLKQHKKVRFNLDLSDNSDSSDDDLDEDKVNVLQDSVEDIIKTLKDLPIWINILYLHDSVNIRKAILQQVIINEQYTVNCHKFGIIHCLTKYENFNTEILSRFANILESIPLNMSKQVVQLYWDTVEQYRKKINLNKNDRIESDLINVNKLVNNLLVSLNISIAQSKLILEKYEYIKFMKLHQNDAELSMLTYLQYEKLDCQNNECTGICEGGKDFLITNTIDNIKDVIVEEDIEFPTEWINIFIGMPFTQKKPKRKDIKDRIDVVFNEGVLYQYYDYANIREYMRTFGLDIDRTLFKSNIEFRKHTKKIQEESSKELEYMTSALDIYNYKLENSEKSNEAIDENKKKINSTLANITKIETELHHIKIKDIIKDKMNNEALLRISKTPK
jgi:hypothetical protein